MRHPPNREPIIPLHLRAHTDNECVRGLGAALVPLALKSPPIGGCKSSETSRVGTGCRFVSVRAQDFSPLALLVLQGNRDLGSRPLSPPPYASWQRAISACVASTVASSPFADAVARLSRRRYLRRRVRYPCAGVAMPPHSPRRHARPPQLRGGGSRSWHSRRSSVAAARSLGARGASYSAVRALCVWLWRRSPSRSAHSAAACGAALALLALAWSGRRTRGGVTLGRRSAVAAARSLGAPSARRLALSACGRWRGPLWVRSPSRRSRGAAAYGAALALLVSRGRAAALAAAWRSAAAPSRRQLALSACCGVVGSARPLRMAVGRRRSRFLSGSGGRRAALATQLPAASRWRSWRWLGRAAALVAA